MAPKRHMRRDCPRCHVALEEVEHEIPRSNVHADHCPKCEGLFLDEGELKRLTGHGNIHRLITEYLGVDVRSDLVCPSCGGLMDEEHFEGDDEASKVHVDVCVSCKGVWLDAGELEAIAALDDAAFKDIPPEKRAAMFDQDLAERRRHGGRNIFARAFANFAHGIRKGTRRFR